MLDERWSDDVEEIGGALRKLLAKESTPERIRAAEASADGRDLALEKHLQDFGLGELEGDAELFARLAFELGRALATGAYVETMPALAVLRAPAIAYAGDALVPAAVARVAVSRPDGVYVQALEGQPRRSAAGDWLVQHRSEQMGQRIGGVAEADRLQRFEHLVSAARMVGAADGLLEYGVAYARERQQFGKLIGGYQGVAHRLADAATLLDSAELLVRKATFSALAVAHGDGGPTEVFAIMVRAKAVEAARKVASTVHQVFGGYGFALEYDVQLYSRRLRSWAMRGPRSNAQLAELGRALLNPANRDAMRHLWHYETGMPLPRWASECDETARRQSLTETCKPRGHKP